MNKHIGRFKEKNPHIASVLWVMFEAVIFMSIYGVWVIAKYLYRIIMGGR